MYVDSSVCQFRIDSGVKQGCIISLWLLNVYMDGVMKEVKLGIGRRGVGFLEDGRKWRLPGLLYVDDLVQCGESEEDLSVIVGWFAEVCRRRDQCR